ncbi:MAG TPA: LLM class flavin-dependent oxidoreductase [Methylomirabilota bacterium]|jgi:alkanesulfonate monooxygenase SsuD/methylene tetrahydromethanopterin reductase-like flavin-dependent oxidoreductase (luciferase family)
MSVTPRGIGVSVMPLDNRREVLVAAAVEADRLGYDAFLLPETWALDVPVVLAEAAVKTRRIVLGTGIVGIWGRSAATLAMMAATLASLSSGRFVLGLGASTAQLAEGLHDVPWERPTARLRRVLTQVRALLRGERIPLAAGGARALKLNLPPAPDVPIYLAGLADESVRLAGELADGWLPFLYPRSQLGAGRALLAEGRARRSSPGELPPIYPSVPTAVAEDPERARAGAAWFVAFYLTTMGPLYRQSLARQGFGKEVEAVLAANAPRNRGVVPPEAQALLDELTIFGTPAQARAALAGWHEAGAARPILLLPPHLTREEIDFTLDAFGASGRGARAQ